MEAIPLDQYRKIVVLTGAGVSVASGLPAYRGPDGLWKDEEIAAYAMAETWREDPLGVWRMFGGFRGEIQPAEPNPAHVALSRFEHASSGDRTLTVITQNVDGLHQKAGSRNVVELHGNLHHTRCTNHSCESEPFLDRQTEFDELPTCKVCGQNLRPHVVLFGEWLPPDAERAAKLALRDCDLFIAVGTSGTVTPAANYVRSANYEGARTIMVNIEPMDPPNPYFDREMLGRAEEVLPELLSI